MKKIAIMWIFFAVLFGILAFISLVGFFIWIQPKPIMMDPYYSNKVIWQRPNIALQIWAIPCVFTALAVGSLVIFIKKLGK